MSSQNNKNDHILYHEARRRAAALPQPIQRYSEAASLLLTAPNNIIFELFNTIVKEIPSDRLLEFIQSSLMDYLNANWENKITQQIIRRLKREQAVDMKAGLKSVPLIRSRATVGPPKPGSPKSPPAEKRESPPMHAMEQSKSRSADSFGTKRSQRSPPLSYRRDDSKQAAIRQIYEHIMWRIHTDNVTQITSLLAKLALDDGYKRGKLKAEIFDDVARNLEEWRSRLVIKLYAFGDAPANDQKLILSKTSGGDLTKWLANYIDGSEKRQNLALLRRLAGALRDRTNNCIYLTHDLPDAIRSLQSGSAIRLALIVDRTKQYEPLDGGHVQEFESVVKPLMLEGKLYVIQSLDCVRFAPDPTGETCC